jgi:hypothetical protein
MKKILATTILAALSLTTFTSHAGTIFSEDFDSYIGGNFTGGQLNSGLAVAYGGNYSGWSKSGVNSTHVVADVLYSGGSAPFSGADFSFMMYQDSLTLNSAISGSNVAGQSYDVTFDMSAGVYQGGSQITTSSDVFWVDLIRADNTLFSSQSFGPGAWTGNMVFNAAGFQYTGDGSGDLRLRIYGDNDNQFDGAINNLAIATEVPEAPTALIMLVAMVGFMAIRRKDS